MRTQAQIAAITFSAIFVFLVSSIAGSQISARLDDTVWQVVASSSPLKSIYVTTDGRRGWAVGGESILTTEDGGAHWTPQTRRTFLGLNGVAATADGRRAWAVGSSGLILATEDAGTHWVWQTRLVASCAGLRVPMGAAVFSLEDRAAVSDSPAAAPIGLRKRV
jgi:photosystem II stability/assembly factor-like uncharacterized protein